MYDPHGNKFVPLNQESVATLPHPQRDWTRFQEGELIEVKGVKMRVLEIGESRLVLKLIKH